MRFRASLVILVAAVLAGASATFAQRPGRGGVQGPGWGRGPTPRNGACFYEDITFKGQYFCVSTGDSLPTLPRDMRDRISSIRLFGRVEVMAFTAEGFRGSGARFTTDVRDLRREGLNDAIMSLRVANDSVGWRGGSLTWGRGNMPREGACFYRDPNFSGDYFCVARGGSYDLVPTGFNDKISSIRVMGGARVIIFENRDYAGRSQSISGDISKMQGFWNDKISSIRVF